MTNIGTPDYQRGVVSAQVLLANPSAATLTTTVTLPPNIETLVLVVPKSASTSGITAIGQTSGMHYLPVLSDFTDGGFDWLVVYYDVSAAVDSQIAITLGAAPAHSWYVYADTGVHVTRDATLAFASAGSGAASASDWLQVAGSDGAKTRPLLTDKSGRQIVTPPDMWTVTGLPGAGAVASGTRGAIAGVVHVCTSISASLVALAAVGLAASLQLRDGPSGAGTVMWQVNLGVSATIDNADTFTLGGLAISGTAGNAMTLEFNVGAANIIETVAFTGYDHT